MSEFSSWQSYWRFQQNVKRHTRYIFTDEVKEFLEIVIATSEKRYRHISSGKIFWRAQHGCEWAKDSPADLLLETAVPYSPERMKPQRDKAKEGRVNPKGIPCLYLATDKETAMAEIRPWIGSQVSVGRFETLKDLKLIDLSVHAEPRTTFYLEEPDAYTRENEVWADIDKSFSEPVTDDDSSADYVPTQVLSELFRSHGYEGLIYKSTLGKGLNIALFDLEVAELLSCHLFEVKSIDFRFAETANPYFSAKKEKQGLI